MPMEKNTNVTDIDNDSRLIIQLKSRKSATIQQSHPTEDLPQDESADKPDSMKRASSPSSPSLPESSPDMGTSRVQRKCPHRKRRKPWSLTVSADTHDTGEGSSLSRNEEAGASVKPDCQLLDYQNQLFFLESLNRRSSRKARQMR